MESATTAPTFGFPRKSVVSYTKGDRKYVLADDGERRLFLAYQPPAAWVAELEDPDKVAALLALARELRELGVRYARVPLPSELLGDILTVPWIDWRPSAALILSFVRETLTRAADPDARKLLSQLDTGQVGLEEALQQVVTVPSWRWLLRGLLAVKLGQNGLTVDVDLEGLTADELAKALTILKGPGRPGLAPKKILTRDGRYITYYVSIDPHAPKLRENLIRSAPGKKFWDLMPQLPVDHLEPRQLAWLGASIVLASPDRNAAFDYDAIRSHFEEAARMEEISIPAETREELRRLARLAGAPIARLGLIASLLFYGGGEPPTDAEIEEIGQHLDWQFTQSEPVRNAIISLKYAQGGSGSPDPIKALFTVPIRGTEWAVHQMADAMSILPEDIPERLKNISQSIGNGLRFMALYGNLYRDVEKLRFDPKARTLRSWLKYDPNDQAFDDLLKEGIASFEFHYPGTPGIRAFGGPRTIKAVDEQTFAQIQQRLLDDASPNHDFDLELLGAWDVEYAHPEHEALKERYPDAEVRTLYHGSDPNRWVGVLTVGPLNPETVGTKVGDMLGAGVYLADSSTKSAQYSLSKFSLGSFPTGVLFEMEAILANKEVVASARELNLLRDQISFLEKVNLDDLAVPQDQLEALKKFDPELGKAVEDVSRGQVDFDALVRAAVAAQFFRTAARAFDPDMPEPNWQAPTKTVKTLWQTLQDPKVREAFSKSAPWGSKWIGIYSFNKILLHDLPEPYASVLLDYLDPGRLLARGGFEVALQATLDEGVMIYLGWLSHEIQEMIDLRHVEYEEGGIESFARALRATVPSNLMVYIGGDLRSVVNVLLKGYRHATDDYRQYLERYGYEFNSRELASAIRREWYDNSSAALNALEQYLQRQAIKASRNPELITMLYAACIDGGPSILGEDRPKVERTIRRAIDYLLEKSGTLTVPYTVEARASEGWLKNNEWMVRSENQLRIKRILHVREKKRERRRRG